MSEQPDYVELVYRNWRGEVRPRKIRPLGVYFGATQWHPEPQWLMNAVDLEDGTTKQFALKDFLGAPQAQAPVAVREENFVGLRYVVSDEERRVLAAFSDEGAARDFWRPIKNSCFKTLATADMVAPQTPSSSCEGQKCPCGAKATRKVGEEEMWGRPFIGHNLTSYVCDEHFWWLMGREKLGIPLDDTAFRGSVEITVFRDGKVLAVNSRNYGGFCGVGGKVEVGETLEQAARRELMEETGCCARSIRFVAGHTLDPLPEDKYRGKWYCAGFLVDIGDQEPRQNEEGTVPFWTTPAEMVSGSIFPKWYEWWFGLLGLPMTPGGEVER